MSRPDGTWPGGELEALAVSTYISPPYLTQATVLEFLTRGSFAPNLERDSLRQLCETADISRDEEIVRGNVILLSAEQYYLRDPHDETRIESLFDQLTERVGARRKSGLSFMGRIAPSLFERGDLIRAETVERVVRARLGTARVLCPYRAKQVSRLAGAASLVRSHSHTITALGRDRFLVEHIGSRPRS